MANALIQDLALIVPDALLLQARAKLLSAGFAPCEQTSCEAVMEPRGSPSPSAHVHLTPQFYIGLFRHSDTLIGLQSLEKSAADPEDERDIICADDPRLPGPRVRRGQGRFPGTLHQIRAPSAHRLVEAYILLTLKDMDQPFELFWSTMLTYMASYVPEDGLLDESKLEPSHRRYFHNFIGMDNRPFAEAFNDLLRSSRASDT